MISKIAKYKIVFSLMLAAYLLVSMLYFEKFFRAEYEYPFFFGKKPFISVVVTSYNYEQYLTQALDSIIAQTYRNYEVVIVDDGSKDNSLEIIKGYTNGYPNFHLYQHENGENRGLPASVKLGVEKAKGEYIAFLESDDFWRKDKLQKIVRMINKHPKAVIIANNLIIFGNNQHDIALAAAQQRDVNNMLKEENYLEKRDDLFNPVQTMSAVCIKADILKKLNFDTPIAAFLDVWLYKQVLIDYPLYYIREPLTFWRKHIKSFNTSVAPVNHYENSDIFIRELNKILENKH